MDKITLKDLEVWTQIGVTAMERATAQRLLITIVLELDLAEAGRTDMESSTTGYDVVANLVQEIAAQRPRKLVEAIAEDVAGAILSREMSKAVTVEVKKFSIPGSRHVAVEIHRTQ